MKRADLQTAKPGIYIVRCQHPSEPRDDDQVIEGPLPASDEHEQRAARGRAVRLQLTSGRRTSVELVQVVDLSPLSEDPS